MRVEQASVYHRVLDIFDAQTSGALLKLKADDLLWRQVRAQVEVDTRSCPDGGCWRCLLSSSCPFRIRLGQKVYCRHRVYLLPVR